MIEARKQYRNNGYHIIARCFSLLMVSREVSDGVVEQAAQRIKDEGKQ